MPKNLIYIILISIICSSCDLRTAEQYYDLAFELEEKEKYAEAITYLDKAIEKKPRFRPALNNRGADKSAIGDFNGAIEDYEKILAFEPQNTLILMNIGNNYKRLKAYDKSVDDYTKALNTNGAIKSDSIYIDFNLNGDWDRDSDYYVRKYRIEFERGISYVYLKKHSLGIRDLEQAIEYNYEIPDASSWIGQAYYELNDTINARNFLTQASKYGLIDAKELLKKIE
jgi:tetratricopeptide (TPR) repeat protein